MIPFGVFVIRYGTGWAVCYNTLREILLYNHLVKGFVGRRHDCTLFCKEVAVDLANKYKQIN
jgi:hypothetical protein